MSNFFTLRKTVFSIEKQALVSDTWSFLCDKNVVIASGFVYGMTWLGFRNTLRRPILTLLLGSVIFAPLAACGAEILCDLLPPKTIGIVPVLFASSIIYNRFIDED